LLLNAAGWRGVHALDAVAHGDGPRTFADCVTQEFQWARSLVVLLLTVTPGCWPRLSARLRAEFVFTQLWYPLYGAMMLVSYLVPVAALLSARPWVNVSYPWFLLLAGLCGATSLSIVAWSRAGGWLRPPGVPLISWETFVYQLARWPWVLLGSLAAILDVISKKPFAFRVTPKGSGALPPLPARVLLPYLALASISAVAAAVQSDAGSAAGYYYFAIVDSCMYALVASVVVGMHLWETSRA
jgi:cellulose synthase (UDP-forming)